MTNPNCIEPDSQWFIDRFDEYVLGRGLDAPTLEESREYVARVYEKGVADGTICMPSQDFHIIGRDSFDKFLLPRRKLRRNALAAATRYIVDALRRNTLFGPEDPILRQAYPLGDGTDMALGWWSIDSWKSSVNEGEIKRDELIEAVEDLKAARDDVTEELQRLGILFAWGARGES